MCDDTVLSRRIDQDHGRAGRQSGRRGDKIGDDPFLLQLVNNGRPERIVTDFAAEGNVGPKSGRLHGLIGAPAAKAEHVRTNFRHPRTWHSRNWNVRSILAEPRTKRHILRTGIEAIDRQIDDFVVAKQRRGDELHNPAETKD